MRRSAGMIAAWRSLINLLIYQIYYLIHHFARIAYILVTKLALIHVNFLHEDAFLQQTPLVLTLDFEMKSGSSTDGQRTTARKSRCYAFRAPSSLASPCPLKP
jgi:hypothetical protein